MLSKRLYGAALMGAMVLTFAAQGCSSDASNPLCCNEFKVGATLDAKIEGNAEAQVAVQAIADFAGIASAAIDDLTTACRSMSEDLDVPAADRDAAEAMTDKQAKMKQYCSLAVTAIGTLKGSATLTIAAQPPKCSASISAKANCQAKCDVSAPKCDFKAHPPVCTGGTLEVSCKGSCTADASVKATVHCEGSCSAECKGSCTATGGVKCAGKCEGTCEGAGGAGTSGVDASGNCQGTCKGTCAVTAPGITCTGSCNGECAGSCKAEGSASASVKCDGKCDADFEPLQCSGGKLEGGCTPPSAKCDANCDASVKAKAECTPPSIAITFGGSIDAGAAAKLEGTLKANLGVVLAFKSRLEGMIEVAGTITGNADGIVSIKAACIPPVIAAAVAAVADAKAAGEATVSVAGAVGS